MATNPGDIPPPDVIEPQSPAELPQIDTPDETPFREPPEITPDTPNVDEPGRGPDELPSVPLPPD
jgi:hypothetical protein